MEKRGAKTREREGRLLWGKKKAVDGLVETKGGFSPFGKEGGCFLRTRKQAGSNQAANAMHCWLAPGVSHISGLRSSLRLKLRVITAKHLRYQTLTGS